MPPFFNNIAISFKLWAQKITINQMKRLENLSAKARDNTKLLLRKLISCQAEPELAHGGWQSTEKLSSDGFTTRAGYRQAMQGLQERKRSFAMLPLIEMRMVGINDRTRWVSEHACTYLESLERSTPDQHASSISLSLG